MKPLPLFPLIPPREEKAPEPMPLYIEMPKPAPPSRRQEPQEERGVIIIEIF